MRFTIARKITIGFSLLSVSLALAALLFGLQIKISRRTLVVAQARAEETQILTVPGLHTAKVEAEQTEALALQILVFLLPASLLAGAGMAVVLRRVIHNPVTNLLEGMVALRQGNLSYRIFSKGNDEFAELANGFNRLAAHLEATTVSKAHLEEREEQLKQVNTDLMKEIFERTAAEDALRESEARLIQFFEALPVGVFVMDTEAKLFYANSIAKQLVGADFQLDDQPEDLLRRFNLCIAGTDQLYPLDRLPIIRALGGETVTISDIEIRRPDTVIPLHTMAAPIFDANGKVQYAIVVCSDISELKKVDRLKNEFISTVSHELRTPLTSIRGSLELIAAGVAGELPAQAKALTDIACKNTERLLHLINDILDMEKIESGKPIFHSEVLDLRSLVDQVLETNRPYGDQFGVTFVLEQPVAQVQVYADNQRLMQVLTNLLSNAAKFSPSPDTVHIAVSRRGGTVRVAITDHGPGIPEEFRGHIFSKFAQADSSDTRQKGGTGLGLSICKTIIERLGGRIGFTTQPHIATTFYVELPEWYPLDAQAMGSPRPAEHTYALPPTGNPMENAA